MYSKKSLKREVRVDRMNEQMIKNQVMLHQVTEPASSGAGMETHTQSQDPYHKVFPTFCLQSKYISPK